MSQTSGKRSSALAQRYAQALLDLASDQAESIGQEIEQLAKLWDDQPELGRLFSGYLLGAAERSQVIEKSFKGQVSDLVYRFMQVLNTKNRLAELPAIAEAYRQLLDEKLGRVQVQAFTAQPLDEAVVADITQKLSEALKQQVILQPQTDSRLLGGLKLKLGDTVYDASVATQLKQLRRGMVQQTRQRMEALIAD